MRCIFLHDIAPHMFYKVPILESPLGFYSPAGWSSEFQLPDANHQDIKALWML